MKTIGNFTFITTKLEGVIIVETKKYGDDRGFFMESYVYKDFVEGGIDAVFVQDNQSKSVKGVLRGLHFQSVNTQGKLIRVISGEVYDVAVDLRKNSKTYGEWVGEYISDSNNRQLYIPQGFAHGFLVTSKQAEFTYKCTDYYNVAADGGIRWDDSDIGIQWPLEEKGIEKVRLSDKDNKQPFFKDIISPF